MLNKSEKNLNSAEKEVPKKVIVEIGSGAIPIETNKDEQYIGIDANTDSFDFVKTNSDILQKGGSDLVRAYAEELPLNNSADEVIMRNVLGHTFGGPTSGPRIKEIKILCKEIKTALKKDGKFIIVETYTPPPLKEVKKILLEEGFVVEGEISKNPSVRYNSSEAQKTLNTETEIKKKYGKNMWENMRDMDSYILVLKKKSKEGD